MSKYIYHIIILIYLYISLFPSVFPQKILAKERSGNTEIIANIPAKYHFKVFGYTAPYSTVEVESVRVFGKTVSEIDGYFEFADLPVSEEATEICLTTIDGEKRAGFPVCVGIPTDNLTFDIGPIILSPTLSISKDLIWEGDQAQASGRTVPSSQVLISYFESPNNNAISKTIDRIMAFFLPAVAEAKQLPLLTISSDRKGLFSVNLPTSKPTSFRIFAKALYKEAPSPKSTTLNFEVGSFWYYWMRFILPKLLLILLVLLILIYLVIYELKHKKLRKYLLYLNEKRFAPFAARARLKLKRISYNLQGYLTSDHK